MTRLRQTQVHISLFPLTLCPLTLCPLTLRSETHTPEHHSYTDLSFAVICLKNKKLTHTHPTHNTQRYVHHSTD